MNQKGFTLIELLATITILSMIMLVAVPNIMSTLDKSKRRTYVEDAKKMISLTEYKIRSNTTIELPVNENTVVAFPLSSLDLTDFSEGPEGGQYDLRKSYVLVARKNNEYIYFATLVEKYGTGATTKYRGVDAVSYSILLKEDAVNNVKDFKSSSLPTEPVLGGSKVISNKQYTISKVIS